MNFKEKKISEDKYKISVENNKDIYAIIELEYSPNRYEDIYIIKFFWKEKYQDTKYADTLELAKKKSKILLHGMFDKISRIKTFESFDNKTNHIISKLYEFNRKDKNIIEEVGNFFTIAYEFELETEDVKMNIPENEEQILLLVKLRAIDQFKGDGIDVDVSFIDRVLSKDVINPDEYEDEDENYIVSILLDIFEDVSDEYDLDEVNVDVKSFLSYGKKMVKKHLPNFYNKYNRELKFEIDNSLSRGIEFSPKKYVVSLEEGINMIELFYEDFDKQNYWKMNDNTSIHINIGIEHKVDWNIAKGVIMLQDYKENEIPYVYKDMVDRQNSLYAKSLFEPIQKYFKENKPDKFDVKEIENVINDIIDDNFEKLGNKNFAINVNNIRKYNYAEFRYVGGEITKETMLEKLFYFCYIVYLMTSDYKEQDYHKKLYKIINE